MMKRILFLALPLALLAAACGSSGDDDMLTSTPWQATEIAGADGVLQAPVEGSTPSLLFEGDSAGGNASCNQYFGTFEIKGSDLSFGPLASTEMFCGDPGVMEQEQAYLAALESVDGWSIEDDMLTLTSDGTPVVTYAAISQDLAGTSWGLVGYNNGKGGFSSVTGEQPVTAEFADGRVAGSSGCNDYTTTYETTEDALIEFGMPAGTRKMCIDSAVMEQEARYLQVLELVDNYKVGVDSLEMFDAEGKRLLQYLPAEG
ncbi:MAG: META domain-containing protein [Actinomycetota bacterium]